MKTAVVLLVLSMVPASLGEPSGMQSASAGLEKYEIDAAHTTIGFAVRHMGLAKVRGRFDSFSGEILFDSETPMNSSVTFSIEAASVNTNHERRDADVRGERLLDAEQFPDITFVSSGIRQSTDGLEIRGDLTLHGVTREVTFPFELIPPMDVGRGIRLAAEGSLSIDRKDYGIQFDRVVDNGALVVGNKVTVDLSLEAIRVAE